MAMIAHKFIGGIIIQRKRENLYCTCGCIRHFIVCWKVDSSTMNMNWFKHYGFIINPCDQGVSNKTINGQQMTVTWHMDNLKQSHKNPWQVAMLAKYLSNIYVARNKIRASPQIHWHVHGSFYQRSGKSFHDTLHTGDLVNISRSNRWFNSKLSL